MTFEQVYQDELDHRAGWAIVRHATEADLRRAQESAYRAKFPKRKLKADTDFVKALGRTDFETLRAPFVTLANSLCESENEIQQRRRKLLNSLAIDAEIPRIKPSPQEGSNQTNGHLRHCYTVWSGTYSTQGYGADRYARNHAESQADLARVHGLRAEVRPMPTKYGTDYGVFVDTTEVGWEIVKRKPGLTLRDWLKSCWKRGVNPRVYNPFLPHGLEEKLGVDYFGNDAK